MLGKYRPKSKTSPSAVAEAIGAGEVGRVFVFSYTLSHLLFV